MNELAGRGERFLARLLDGLVMGAGALVIFIVPQSLQVAAGVSAVCIVAVIQLYLLATRGQTLGKIACKIRIVDAKTFQNTGLVQNAVRREVVNGLLKIIPLYALIDPLFILRDDQRCLHDMIAGTIVIKAPR